jgi:prepilin-type N-terminal cleavage/methylation domain-containing protein
MSRVTQTSLRLSLVERKGFTLIEMSMVLVIIGLIIGGIMVGRDLIRASQLRSVSTDVARYTQAIIDFREKYQALPGDFTGAQALWGTPSVGSCPTATNNGTTDPVTATCNGNGDGVIGAPAGPSWPNNGSLNSYEFFLAWKHLANAGFVDGNYTGVTGPASSYNSVVGVNVPASQIPGAGYTLFYAYLPNGSSLDYPNIVGHVLQFGSASSVYYNTSNAALTPTEALSIDTKLDDGLPAYGNVRSPNQNQSGNANCVTSNTASQATYYTTYNGIACSLGFLLGL